jgi:hypothetical protein
LAWVAKTGSGGAIRIGGIGIAMTNLGSPENYYIRPEITFPVVSGVRRGRRTLGLGSRG